MLHLPLKLCHSALVGQLHQFIPATSQCLQYHEIPYIVLKCPKSSPRLKMKYSRERELDDEGGDEREEGREEEGARIARPLVTNWSDLDHDHDGSW